MAVGLKSRLSFLIPCLLRIPAGRAAIHNSHPPVNDDSVARRLSGAQVEDKEVEFDVEEPSPSECCGQGCAQCVYIKYGEALLKQARSIPPERVKQTLAEKVKDPNLRAFIFMELGIR